MGCMGRQWTKAHLRNEEQANVRVQKHPVQSCSTSYSQSGGKIPTGSPRFLPENIRDGFKLPRSFTVRAQQSVGGWTPKRTRLTQHPRSSTDPLPDPWQLSTDPLPAGQLQSILSRMQTAEQILKTAIQQTTWKTKPDSQGERLKNSPTLSSCWGLTRTRLPLARALKKGTRELK